MNTDAKGYTPTPRQIRRACKRIQAGWTEAERERRMVNYASPANRADNGYKREPYRAPTIRIADLGVAS